MPKCLTRQIFVLFERFGSECYGESVSQLDHALQCAEAAQAHGSCDAVVAAALLHDVGQFVDNAGNSAERFGSDARHEDLGARFLSSHFPACVTEPVRLHVAAKRYLCAVEPGYVLHLSEASRISLALQGGPMCAQEAAWFVDNPYAGSAIDLRKFDDAAKRPNWRGPGIESYRDLLERLQRA